MDDGIFGTDIDLSALDSGTSYRLGAFFGEQILAAEARGYRKAIEDLRDGKAWTLWCIRTEYYYDGDGNVAADYLEARLTAAAAAPGEETRTDG